MTAVVSTRCRRCGAELRDRFSRMLGYGPCCRKHMNPDQLADALLRNRPGYVPPATPRSASPQARRNRSEVARVTAPLALAEREPAGRRMQASPAPVAEPVEETEPRATCSAHGGIAGACPQCRREAAEPAARIIAATLRRPMAERLVAERAASRRLLAAYLPATRPR